MGGLLRIEHIYEAALDDAALQDVAMALTRRFAARSALLHWTDSEGGQTLAHSQYFTDAQLDKYSREFAACDPWLAATAAPQKQNQVHDLERLVPTADFVRSEFYNSFLRPMGDDTARCLGVRVSSGEGCGFLALQRSRRDREFSAFTLQDFRRTASHLRRMLILRGQLTSMSARVRDLQEMLDRLVHPALLVDKRLSLRRVNLSAERLFKDSTMVTVRDGRLHIIDRRAQRDFERCIARATACEGGGSTLEIRDREGTTRTVTVAPFHSEGLALVMFEAGLMARDAAAILRARYRLSPSEAALATLLHQGLSPREIATARGTTIGTTRYQIKQICLKLECRGQSEIVRIVASLPPII